MCHLLLVLVAHPCPQSVLVRSWYYDDFFHISNRATWWHGRSCVWWRISRLGWGSTTRAWQHANKSLGSLYFKWWNLTENGEQNIVNISWFAILKVIFFKKTDSNSRRACNGPVKPPGMIFERTHKTAIRQDSLADTQTTRASILKCGKTLYTHLYSLSRKDAVNVFRTCKCSGQCFSFKMPEKDAVMSMLLWVEAAMFAWFQCRGGTSGRASDILLAHFWIKAELEHVLLFSSVCSICNVNLDFRIY